MTKQRRPDRLKVSPNEEVRRMFKDSADSYAEMMNAEIDFPVYADIV